MAFPGGAVDKLLLLPKAGWSGLGLKGCCILSFFFFLTQSPHVSLKRISSHLKVTLFFLLGKGDSRGENNLERNCCKESEFL